MRPFSQRLRGHIIKQFLLNQTEKIYDGCYQFESKAAVDAYMAGDIFKMIMENPDWPDYLVRICEVHAKAAKIQKQAKANAT